ncbi:MAG: hypothetical protein AAF585_25600 [Verrucomicrobiota bacterium]
MTVAFTEEEKAWHKTAQFGWAPFVARLLSHGPIRGKSDELPNDIRALNSESIDALKEIMNRAVWRFLARECGWRQRRICVGSDLQLQDARLWNQPTPELRFTHESIELLLSIYNATRGSNRVEKARIPECLSANGDVILYHLVFRRLYENPVLASISTGYHWGGWTERNPLNALSAFPICSDPSNVAWELLLESSMRAFAPWLVNYIADEWLRNEQARWQGASAIQSSFQIQKEMCCQLIEAAGQVNRQDILIPLLEYFQKNLKNRNEHLNFFESQTKRKSMSERREIGASWSDFLALTDTLEGLQQQALELHPVERSGPEKLYLSMWEELDFSEVLTTAAELQQKLTPRLS